MAIYSGDYVPNQPIMNTYIPLPIMEMKQALAMKQLEQDKTEEAGRAVKELSAKFGDLDYVHPYVNAQTNEFEQIASPIAGKNKAYAKNLESQIGEISAKIAAEGITSENKKKMTELVSKAKTYYNTEGAVYDKKSKDYAKAYETMLKSKDYNKTLGSGTAAAFTNKVKEFLGGNLDTQFEGLTPGEYTDHDAALQKIVDPMKADKKETAWFKQFGDEFYKMKSSSQTLDRFLNSEGKMQNIYEGGRIHSGIKDYYKSGGKWDNDVKNDYENKAFYDSDFRKQYPSIEDYRKDKFDESLQRVVNINAEYASGFDKSYSPGLTANGKEKQTEDSIYTPTKNGIAVDNLNLDELKVPTNFEYKTPTLDDMTAYNSMTGQSYTSDPKEKAKKALQNKINTRVTDQVKRLNTVLGKNEYNSVNYLKDYNESVKKMKKLTLPGEMIQPEQAKVYNELLQNSRASDLYNIPGEGQMGINDIAEKYKVDPDEIKIRPNLIHWESVDPNHKGAMMEVTMEIKGEKTIAALLPINDNITAESALISEIGQNSFYKGIDTYTETKPYYDPSKNVNIFTYTKPTPKGKHPFQTMVIVQDLDEQGNIETEEKLSYQTFKENIIKVAKSKLNKTINSNQPVSEKDKKKFYSNSQEDSDTEDSF